MVAKIESENNLADSFTKALPQKTFESHLERIGVRLVHNSLQGKWEIAKINALKSYCKMLEKEWMQMEQIGMVQNERRVLLNPTAMTETRPRYV